MVFRVKDELTFMKIDGTFYFRGGTFNITKNSLRLRAHSFNVGTFLSRSIASTFFNFPWRLFKIKINLTTPQNQTQPPLTLPLTHPTLPLRYHLNQELDYHFSHTYQRASVRVHPLLTSRSFVVSLLNQNTPKPTSTL